MVTSTAQQEPPSLPGLSQLVSPIAPPNRRPVPHYLSPPCPRPLGRRSVAAPLTRVRLLASGSLSRCHIRSPRPCPDRRSYCLLPAPKETSGLSCAFSLSEINLTQVNIPVGLQAWYGPMAAHYRNGGLPPWAAAGGGGVKAPLLQNDYNANSGVSYPPTSNPKAQYENPAQFGVYGNVPPSNTQTTGVYSNATGMTGYTAASYHTANTVSSTPPPQSFSPQPQTIAHSQYTSTASSYEPYGAPQTMYNANPSQYRPPSSGPTPTPYGAQMSPVPQSPYGAVPGYDSPTKGPMYAEPAYDSPSKAPMYAEPAYDSPSKAPTYTEPSGSAPAPSYSGGAYGANQYPKDKGWEYTAPPAGSPTKH